MIPAYLHWLSDLLDEADVPLNDTTAPEIDAALRRIAGMPGATPEALMQKLRVSWLRLGPSGRQLLAGLLRHQLYSRRSSALRPTEGGEGYTSGATTTRSSG